MPVQQARARSRQQKILTAAASVFAKRGYQDAGMDEIAQVSGTSKGGVYFHFPGKDAVLLALLDQTSALLRRKVEKAIAAENDPVARAEAALHVLLRTLSKHRSLARIFAIEALGAGGRLNQRVLQIQDEFAELIQEQLDDAIASGAIPPIDTRIAAQAWIGIFHHVIMRWLMAKDRGGTGPDLDETYETIRIMLFRSVGAHPVPAAGNSVQTVGSAQDTAQRRSR